MSGPSSPPHFSSLFFPLQPIGDKHTSIEEEIDAPPAFAPVATSEEHQSSSAEAAKATGAASRDTKDPALSKDIDDGEPPPPYTEGSSPLDTFNYVMAAAGGAASIITQVSQGGGAPLLHLNREAIDRFCRIITTNWVIDVGSEETISLDLR